MEEGRVMSAAAVVSDYRSRYAAVTCSRVKYGHLVGVAADVGDGTWETKRSSG
jgi:hypothetical protein